MAAILKMATIFNIHEGQCLFSAFIGKLRTSKLKFMYCARLACMIQVKKEDALHCRHITGLQEKVNDQINRKGTWRPLCNLE